MSSKLSHTENAKLLSQRISKGDIDQYFGNFSKDDAEKLSKAKESQDFDEMAIILQNNLINYARPFEPVLNSMYDDQIEALANRLLRNYVKEIESDAVENFEDMNIQKIRELREKMDLRFSHGLKERAENIRKQLDKAIQMLSTPPILQKEVKRLIEEKNKKLEDVRKSKIVEWKKYGKTGLVIWGKNGIMAIEYLEKKKKIPKTKIKFVPTREEWEGKTKEQIQSRKKQPFSVKERLFVKSRKNKDARTIRNDYFRAFGEVRTEKEINKLIKESRV